MEFLLKNKNKLAIFLIVLTLARIAATIVTNEGIFLVDLLDYLVPLGGGIYLLTLKQKKNKDNQ